MTATQAIDLERVVTFVREVAAEEIMPRFNKLTKGDIRHKGGRGDFATTADLESERVLGARLSAYLPGSLVVGEEGTEKRPELLGAIAGEDPVWVIDPLDGTHNFADGIAKFCVIVALTQAGETLAAWIHDPVADKTILAERGSGAWEAGRRLTVAPAVPIEEMRGALYTKAGRPGISANFDEARRHFAATGNSRCAGHEYLAMARGETHFTLFSRLLPWDHAGGALIHAEAGGYNACWDGAEYKPTRHTGGLLLAPDRESWQTIAGLVLAPRG